MSYKDNALTKNNPLKIDPAQIPCVGYDQSVPKLHLMHPDGGLRSVAPETLGQAVWSKPVSILKKMNKNGRQRYDQCAQYVTIADFEELMKANQQLALAYVPPDDISKKLQQIEDSKPQTVQSARPSSLFQSIQQNQSMQMRPQFNISLH